ncbi:response regulator transcription factor [Streptomyces sp. NPDC060198]|uniref:response regulator transcription factor n=1 Tax=Streptomyces sp. NPDC060198 TaxID=3347070 RepID=UPI003662046B
MRIAVIEQRSLVRHGLESVLSGIEGAELVPAPDHAEGFTGNGLGADVILYGPPRTGGEEYASAAAPSPGGTRRPAPARESVGRLATHGRVLVIWDVYSTQPLLPVVRAGALGCVTERVETDELLRAVRTVHGGGLHVSPPLMARLQDELAAPAAETEPRQLARRELETLRLLVGGLTHGQIGRRLGLTEATVSTYVKRIRTKLDVGNKADMTRRAIELGLLAEPPGTVPGPRTAVRPAARQLPTDGALR